MTYIEAALVEQPAINIFKELGWQTLDCYSVTFGTDNLLARDNQSEIVLTCELRESLIHANPDCTANEIILATDEIDQDSVPVGLVRNALESLGMAHSGGYQKLENRL